MMTQAVDTVYVQASRDSLSIASDWALVIVAAAVVLTALASVIMVWRTSRAVRRASRSAERKIDPLLDRSRAVAANVEFITATLRTDVEGLHGSIGALSARLKEASERMEARVEEFNALLKVVQGEAEDVFLDTASTARGVRAGAQRLVSRRAEEGISPSPAPALPPDASPPARER